MIYGYIRVSSDKQTVKNQEFEIGKFAREHKIKIDLWIEETISSTKELKKRKFGKLLEKLQPGDVIITTELSRLGRNLMQIMGILNHCMTNQVKIITTKEHYELGDNINAKVLAFAFGLSAEIERNLISQRTREALARVRAEGKKLGRPIGATSQRTKLKGKEAEIEKYLQLKISKNKIARMLGVHRLTLADFMHKHNLTSLPIVSSNRDGQKITH